MRGDGGLEGHRMGEDRAAGGAGDQAHPGLDELALALDEMGDRAAVDLPDVEPLREPPEPLLGDLGRAGGRPGSLDFFFARAGEGLAQPGDGPRRRPPGAQVRGRIDDRLARVAEAVGGGHLQRQRLVAQQVGRDVLVRLPGRPEPLPGLGRVALAAEGEQGLGVGPGGRRLVVPLQQLGQLVVPIQVQEPGGQGVADPLVVAGVEPEHVAEVPGRLLAPAQRPEGMGQPLAGTHVGPGLQQAPEVAHVLLEGVGPDRPLPGGHRLLVQREGLLAALGLLGEQDVGVGAIGRDREGLPGEVGPTLGVVLFEGQVQDLLRLAQGSLLGGPHQLAHETPHDPLQGPAVGDDGRRLGLSLRPARSLRGASSTAPSSFSWANCVSWPSGEPPFEP